MSTTHAKRVAQFGAEHFTLTEDHLKLLRRAEIQFDAGMEWGGPAIDFKRPFGNGDLYGDMREILGRHTPPGNAEEADERSLRALYESLGTALRIVVQNATAEPGRYESPRYFSEWKPMEAA